MRDLQRYATLLLFQGRTQGCPLKLRRQIKDAPLCHRCVPSVIPMATVTLKMLSAVTRSI